jgi:putative tricarboxylic transport membrane protein
MNAGPPQGHGPCEREFPAMADPSDDEKPVAGVISYRTMNIAVAVVLMAVAAVVMISSFRLGAGWAKDVGPDSGYFPFYVALIMFAASAATLVQSLLSRRPEGRASFVTGAQLKMVLQVVIPMTVFVVLSIYIGIYISTFLFIGFFMVWHGHYPILKTLPLAILVPVALFIVFEIWFLVPLPKGPLEAWLGY